MGQPCHGFPGECISHDPDQKYLPVESKQGLARSEYSSSLGTIRLVNVVMGQWLCICADTRAFMV